MRKKPLIICSSVDIVIALIVATFAWGRLRGPDAVQARAMARLNAVQPPAGMRNAWPSLWLINYAVPPNQTASVYAHDRQRMQTWIAARMHGSFKPFVSSADGQYRKLPAVSAKQHAVLCQPWRPSGCLAYVRAHTKAVAAVVASQSPRLARFQAMRHDNALWDTLPVSTNAPVPPLVPLQGLWMSSAALTFVRGQHERALTSLCINARMLRHLHAHTNSMLMAMVIGRWMQANESLLTNMLQATPSGQMLPASCHQAFAPVARVDVNPCPAMQRRYATMRHLALRAYLDQRRPAWLDWLYFDRHKNIGTMIAPTFVWPCTQAVRNAMFADRPVDAYDAPQAQYGALDIFTNWDGVQAAEATTWPLPFARYLKRNENYAASLRLTAWLIHMHATHAAAVNWALALRQARPELMQAGDRSFTLTADGRHIRMTCYLASDDHDALVLALPLPSTPATASKPAPGSVTP
ncbi:MAG TPA: hypothetical protein VF269_02900 [Rhodanobacteraceae bacterium]